MSLDATALRQGARLTVDLGAVVDNWRSLKARLAGADCAAVLKADAYGLGAARVGAALAAAGCRQFFVAHLDEAIVLKPHLPASATLRVLHGPMPGSEREFVDHGIEPVLNGLGQFQAWRALAHRLDRELPAFVQVDTGMARLGLAPFELDRLADDPRAFDGVRLTGVMSHLACADEPAHRANAAQRAAFVAARRRLPPAPASLANSSGIFLGADWHFDLARPGAALYGVAPVPGQPNPMRPVVRLQAQVIQVRAVDAGAAVGYAHAWAAAGATRIATAAVGYADGYLRALGARGACAWLGGQALPVVGRVSMDTITLDVGAVPEGAVHAGTLLDLVPPEGGVDELAARAGTIGYEILTSLGTRYDRVYREPDAA